MSNRLAISAAFSILMMACYVLFGEDAARVPLGPQRLAEVTGPVSASVSASVSAPTRAGPLQKWIGVSAGDLLDRR